VAGKAPPSRKTRGGRTTKTKAAPDKQGTARGVSSGALTVKQAAREVGCSESLIRNLVRSGEVPCRKESFGVPGQERQRTMIDQRHLALLKRKTKARQGGRQGRGATKKAPDWALDLPGVAISRNPPRSAEARVNALKRLLNGDLTKRSVLGELVDRCRTVWYGGRRDLSDDELTTLREDLEAVRYYCHKGREQDEAQGDLLRELHHWTDWPTELGPLRLRECTTNGRVEEMEDEDSGLLVPCFAPIANLAHFIAGYYMATVERLVVAGLYPPVHCKRDRCRRWFVPTRDQVFCCTLCRTNDERGQ